jgi:4-alpha-glucanotransferase
MERKSGVLMHISSLFGDYSIGSFGTEAKYFIDFLAECGFTYWQVLPFCPADKCNSPYKSPSAFGGNPYFIDLNSLAKQNLIASDELNAQKQSNPYICEYDKLYETRLDLLKVASERFPEKSLVNNFISGKPHLESFCKFMAIKKKNNEKPWFCWDTEEYDDDVFFMWKFIQYIFFEQWKEILNYAHEKGIKIIGDIPIYVDLDSSDVWANKHLFKLDKENYPVTVAGVPPDYFSQDGQLWGNPIYRWDEMEKENFRWWRDRISHMTTIFDGIRIDHFRGVESFWEVPYGEKTAKNGTMSKGPGMKLINAIKEECNDALIIAEDLGLITKEVEALVTKSGFPGMRVFQFAFMGDANSPHLPHNYINNCIAYTGTHDNNTLLGYLWELDDNTRKNMLEYCGFKEIDWENGYEYIIRTMMASHAGTVIMTIQDLLKYGSDTRLNTPGRAEGNWMFRLTKEQLDSIDRSYFNRLNTLYSRK